jgi:hypothetical protein
MTSRDAKAERSHSSLAENDECHRKSERDGTVIFKRSETIERVRDLGRFGSTEERQTTDFFGDSGFRSTQTPFTDFLAPMGNVL